MHLNAENTWARPVARAEDLRVVDEAVGKCSEEVQRHNSCIAACRSARVPCRFVRIPASGCRQAQGQ